MQPIPQEGGIPQHGAIPRHEAAQAPASIPRHSAVPRADAAPQSPAHGQLAVSSGLSVSWVGAHGGAGVSTLAELLGGLDLERRWPDPARGEPNTVLLVARTHASGLRSVSRALETLHAPQQPAGPELLAVVLVADAPGRLPLHLMQRIRVLRSVTDVRRVPWIPAWRGDKRSGALPKAVQALAELAGGGLEQPVKRKRTTR